MPIGLAIAGANRNDFKLFAETVRSVPVRRPQPTRTAAQGLCLDKGYDYEDVERGLKQRHITPHIRRRGEPPLIGCVRGKPRRWKVHAEVLVRRRGLETHRASLPSNSPRNFRNRFRNVPRRRWKPVETG